MKDKDTIRRERQLARMRSIRKPMPPPTKPHNDPRERLKKKWERLDRDDQFESWNEEREKIKDLYLKILKEYSFNDKHNQEPDLSQNQEREDIAKELEQNLSMFTGTEGYTRFSRVMPNFLLTDGMVYLVKTAQAFWLLDIVISALMTKKEVSQEQFMCVKLTVNEDQSFIVEITDGNYKPLYKQRGSYTDFPLREFSFYVSKSDDYWVALLPSEY